MTSRYQQHTHTLVTYFQERCANSFCFAIFVHAVDGEFWKKKKRTLAAAI